MERYGFALLCTINHDACIATVAISRGPKTRHFDSSSLIQSSPICRFTTRSVHQTLTTNSTSKHTSPQAKVLTETSRRERTSGGYTRLSKGCVSSNTHGGFLWRALAPGVLTQRRQINLYLGKELGGDIPTRVDWSSFETPYARPVCKSCGMRPEPGSAV